MATAEVMTRPPQTMLEIYESLPEGTRVQLIKNKLIMAASPFTNHQEIIGKLFNTLYNYLQDKGLGVVFIAPYDVHLDSENVFQPDIIFVSQENRHKIKENGFYGAPDLVIEILSPSTAIYDKGDKKEVYEQHGVKEYWIVNPQKRAAEGFELIQGKFEPLLPSKGTIKLHLLNIALPL